MIRISEIHADGRAAKTYLAAPGSPDLDLLPNEVVGCAFLVDYRRHSHDVFLLLQRILAAGFAIERRERVRHGVNKLFSIDMAWVTSDRLEDGRGGKSSGSGCSRG